MFRTKKRFNSIIVIILICATFFLGPAQNAFALTEETQIPAATQSETEEPERLNEVIGLREKNSKTYLLTDGTYEYVGYAEDIHYEDADGNLVEIDNAITDKPTKEGYTYSNTANSWHTYFANSLCEKNAVVLVKDKYTLTFCMVDAQTQSKVVQSSELNESDSVFDEILAADNRSIVYKDAVKNVDIAYTVKTNILKEDIILRAATAPNIFEFDVTAEGLTVLEKEGTISFVNSEGEDVFNLAPMYMEDANGKYSDKVEYAVEKNEGSYKITITVDKDFLNATDTQYPVIVDPSVMISGSSVTFDTCVDQQYPNSNYYLSQNLWTGGLLNTNAMRTFIKFTLPTDIPAACVTSAYLRIKKNANATPTIRAYRVTEEWTPSNVKWNDQPDYITVPVSGVAYNDSGDWYRIDNVTNFVKYWLSGTYENYGLVLKEPTESNTNQKTRFYSSDAPSPNKPELHIEYTLESVDVKIACDGLYRTAVGSSWASTASTALEKADDAFVSQFGIDFNAASVVSWTSCIDDCSEGSDCDYTHGEPNDHYTHLNAYGNIDDAVNDLGMANVDLLVCVSRPFWGFCLYDSDEDRTRYFFGLAYGLEDDKCIIVHNAVNMLSWQEMRHEISHLYGCYDHYEYAFCIMYFDDVSDTLPYPNEWCSECRNYILNNRLIH